MLYAALESDQWPLQWEELEYLAKKLKNMNWTYDVVAERSIFGSLPAHRFVLIKWEARKSINDSPKREEVGYYKTMEEIIPMLKLLISAEEDKLKEMGFR